MVFDFLIDFLIIYIYYISRLSEYCCMSPQFIQYRFYASSTDIIDDINFIYRKRWRDAKESHFRHYFIYYIHTMPPRDATLRLPLPSRSLRIAAMPTFGNTTHVTKTRNASVRFSHRALEAILRHLGRDALPMTSVYRHAISFLSRRYFEGWLESSRATIIARRLSFFFKHAIEIYDGRGPGQLMRYHFWFNWFTRFANKIPENAPPASFS